MNNEKEVDSDIYNNLINEFLRLLKNLDKNKLDLTTEQLEDYLDRLRTDDLGKKLASILEKSVKEIQCKNNASKEKTEEKIKNTIKYLANYDCDNLSIEDYKQEVAEKKQEKLNKILTRDSRASFKKAVE